jgi:hypothetical protein
VTTQTETAVYETQRLAVAAGAALLVAGLVLVMFVLPAEYAIDPLGIGARTGLLDVGVTGQQVAALENAAAGAGAATGGEQAAVITPSDKPFSQETRTFTIAPSTGIEYKYRLDKGKVLLFSWKATAPVNFEAHAEPDGAPRGYAQTYEKADGRAEASGSLLAPFTGIHGWYWENNTGGPVTLTLTSAGFYNLSHEFQPGQPVKNKSFP